MSVMKKIKLGNGEVTGSGEALGKGGRNLPKEREVALRRPRREDSRQRAQRVQSLRGGKALVEPEARKEAGEAAASRPGQGRAGPSRVSLAIARNFDCIVSEYRSYWRV